MNIVNYSEQPEGLAGFQGKDFALPDVPAKGPSGSITLNSTSKLPGILESLANGQDKYLAVLGVDYIQEPFVGRDNRIQGQAKNCRPC